MGIFKTWIKDGEELWVNPLLRYARGGVMVPESSLAVMIAAANGVSPITVMEGPQDSASKVFALYGFHDSTDAQDVQDRLEVTIRDLGWRRKLHNDQPPLVNHVFGDVQNNFYLLSPLFFQPQQIITFQTTNNSAAGNSNFSPAMRYAKIEDSKQTHEMMIRWIKENKKENVHLYPFWLTNDNGFVTIPASGRRTLYLRNTHEQDLVLFWAMATAITAGAAGNTTDIFQSRIFDPASKMPLQETPVLRTEQFGTAQFPYPLPSPIIMRSNEVIEIVVDNLVTDASADVNICLQGVSNYYDVKSLDDRNDIGSVQPAPLLQETISKSETYPTTFRPLDV